MIRVLGRKTSGNVQKVVWTLEELGLPYEREDYGQQFNNTADESYLRLNPNGRIPTVIDGDVVMWESNSILRYLGSKFGKLYAADAAGRGYIDRWMDWQLGTLDNAYLPIFRELKTPADQRSAPAKASAAALGAVLSILERGMNGAPWVAGNALTIADITLGPAMHRCFALGEGVPLPELKNVRRWHDAYASRPAFQKAVG